LKKKAQKNINDEAHVRIIRITDQGGPHSIIILLSIWEVYLMTMTSVRKETAHRRVCIRHNISEAGVPDIL
jgi:hypothetical protein